MANQSNPYQSPGTEPPGGAPSAALTSGSKGFIGPMLLAWIGLLLAVGIVGTVVMLAFLGGEIGPGGVVASILVLATPPLRLIWVVYTAVQRRRYQEHWPPGASTLLLVVWIFNVVLLCVDAALIFVLATCIAALSAAGN